MNKRTWTVYMHTSPSEKVYIGITSQKNIGKRWQGGYGYVYNNHFYNAIKKYGWKNFRHEIVIAGTSKDIACNIEQYLIEKHNADNPEHGYNKSPGGGIQNKESIKQMKKTCIKRGVFKASSKRMKEIWADPKQRAKRIEAMQNKPRTAEQKARYKEASAYRIGKPLTDEVKAKLSHAMSQKTGERAVRKKAVYQIDTQTGEIINTYSTARIAAEAVGVSINRISCVCRSINKCCKGYYWCFEEEYTEELFKDKLGLEITENGKIARKGERSSMLGKTHSQETKDKIRESHSKPVQCIETGKVYSSVKEAGEAYGIGLENISRQIRGKVKRAGGHTWRYIDKEIYSL